MPAHCLFQESARKLTIGDREVRLRPKAAAVLVCLMRRKGQVVSNPELLDAVWGGLDVSPDLVREQIFDLRAALGDDARAPRFIETVRGRGVRLIGEMEPVRAPVHRQRVIIRP